MKRSIAFFALMTITCILEITFNHAQDKRISTSHNGTDDCPQPRVGTCSCTYCRGKLCQVLCSGLDAMPRKLSLTVTHLEITQGSIQQVPKDYFLNHTSMFVLKIVCNHLSAKFRPPKNVRVL
ncbi:uncharacterized protein LOC110235341 [Exaiptasia diaphana]|uniref:Uncharacterized protein n=1 Tax=Exaiptasia diaphana TaxID=2652724 RepID=A0A913WZE1_EXADI|nr:uncharacterized protein LOC110235341 [Exaiptasia diaphana]